MIDEKRKENAIDPLFMSTDFFKTNFAQFSVLRNITEHYGTLWNITEHFDIVRYKPRVTIKLHCDLLISRNAQNH